jgi:hypothetical protein
MAHQPLVGKGLLIVEASRSHSDTSHSVGLLWTSDQPDAQTSTWQHTTLTRDRHPCPRRDSNSQSQQASGRRPTPGRKQTKRLWSSRPLPRRRAQVFTRKDSCRDGCRDGGRHTLFCLTASKQSGSFTCELLHRQPWTDVSKRPSVPLQSRGEIMSRVDLRAAAGRVECHVFCYF